MSTVIAIPVETKVRELDGKIWLGLNLVKNNNHVLLGPSYEIHKTFDKNGADIIIKKDPGDGTIETSKKLKSAGITVCGLDTEGGVFESLDKYTQNKRRILEVIDAFFAWGESQAKAITEQYVTQSNNVYVTGNPRFDLLQPKLRNIYYDRAVPLTEQYGDYILFNGNFSLANPYRQQVIMKSEDIYGSTPQQKRIHANRIFHLFLDAIYQLQKEFPETNIIIRPHPSEDNTTYEEEFSGYEHIHVEDSGDVRNWIAGASVTLHHDCTTGIESALMGVPVVSYRPIQNEEYEAELPQVVSEQAFTLDELTAYVSECLQDGQPYEMDADQTAHLKQYFHNIDESAAENICNVIESLELPSEKNYDKLKPNLKGDLERRVKSSRWSDQVLTVYDGVHKLLGKESRREQRQYHRQKFPGLEKEEILERIEQMDQVLDVGPVSVEPVPLTNDTFYIRPEQR